MRESRFPSAAGLAILLRSGLIFGAQESTGAPPIPAFRAGTRLKIVAILDQIWSEDVVRSVADGTLVPFIAAGVWMDTRLFPSWRNLLQRLITLALPFDRSQARKAEALLRKRKYLRSAEAAMERGNPVELARFSEEVF